MIKNKHHYETCPHLWCSVFTALLSYVIVWHPLCCVHHCQWTDSTLSHLPAPQGDRGQGPDTHTHTHTHDTEQTSVHIPMALILSVSQKGQGLFFGNLPNIAKMSQRVHVCLRACATCPYSAFALSADNWAFRCQNGNSGHSLHSLLFHQITLNRTSNSSTVWNICQWSLAKSVTISLLHFDFVNQRLIPGFSLGWIRENYVLF